MIELVDATDKDGSPANNSAIAGSGDATSITYDGFDRKVRVVDAVGNETLYDYDPAGHVILRKHRGKTGGPSQTSNSTAGNVDLSATESKYDELSRLYQTDRLLFVPTGTPPPANTHAHGRPPDAGRRADHDEDRVRPQFTADVHRPGRSGHFDERLRRGQSADPDDRPGG